MIDAFFAEGLAEENPDMALTLARAGDLPLSKTATCRVIQRSLTALALSDADYWQKHIDSQPVVGC